MPSRPATHGASRTKAQAKAYRAAYDEQRGTSTTRLYDSRWRKARLGFLRKHPLCAECEKRGQMTAANVVDHIIPHRGDPVLFWDRANWQPLCTPDHNRKTATEDSGFARRLPTERSDRN